MDKYFRSHLILCYLGFDYPNTSLASENEMGCLVGTKTFESSFLLGKF